MVKPVYICDTEFENLCHFYREYYGDNETGSRSPCMRTSSDPPKMKKLYTNYAPNLNFGPIERGEKQTNNID